MARHCEVCGKTASMGNRVTTRGKAKYLGGVGTKVTGIARRKFQPNLQRLRVTVGKSNTSMLVCTRCIRSGSVAKLVRRAPFKLTMQGGKGAKPAAAAAS
jgi:large subunit ribosomal protein L28